MDITSDDIAALRSKNVSDDKILDQIGQYDPSAKSDFDTLAKKGAKPSDIINQYVTYKAANPTVTPPKSGGVLADTLSNIGLMGKGLAYGAGQTADNLSSTLRGTGLSGAGATGATGKFLDNLANSGGPYDPASNHLSLAHPLDSAAYLPRALMEALPAVTGYGAAGALATAAAPEALLGAGAAGLLGAGAFGMGQHLGPNADAIAQNAGRQAATSGDVAGAILPSVAQSGIDAVGNQFALGKFLKPVTGAGTSAATQTAMNLAKAAGVNAGTAGASDAIGQVGTKDLSKFSPSEVLQAAQTGGIVGGAVHGIVKTPEMIGNRKFSPYTGDNQDVTDQTARDLAGPMVSGDASSPADAPGMLKAAASLYPKKVAAALKDKLAQAKASGGEEGPDQGALDDHKAQADLANNLLTNISKGNNLDPSQIAAARSQLDPSVHMPLLQADQIKRLQQQLGTPADNGTSANSYDMMRLFHSMERAKFTGAAAGAGLAAMGLPGVGIGVGLAPFALMGARMASRGINRQAHTVGDFVDRFNTPDPVSPSASPGVPPAPITDPRQLLPPPSIKAPPPPGNTPPDRGVSQNGYARPIGPDVRLGPDRQLPAPPIRPPDLSVSPRRSGMEPNRMYVSGDHPEPIGPNVPESDPSRLLASPAAFRAADAARAQAQAGLQAQATDLANRQNTGAATDKAHRAKMVAHFKALAKARTKFGKDLGHASKKIAHERAQAAKVTRNAVPATGKATSAPSATKVPKAPAKVQAPPTHPTVAGKALPVAEAPKSPTPPAQVKHITPHLEVHETKAINDPVAHEAGKTRNRATRTESIADSSHLKLSKADKAIWTANKPGVLHDALHNINGSDDMKVRVAQATDGMSKEGTAAIAKHLSDHKTSGGKSFYGSFKYKTGADQRAANTMANNLARANAVRKAAKK